MDAAYLETNGGHARPSIVRCDTPLAQIPMPRLCASSLIPLEILCVCASYSAIKESPMLDLLFLGGGVALLCLMIAYARLTNRI